MSLLLTSDSRTRSINAFLIIVFVHGEKVAFERSQSRRRADAVAAGATSRGPAAPSVPEVQSLLQSQGQGCHQKAVPVLKAHLSADFGGGETTNHSVQIRVSAATEVAHQLSVPRGEAAGLLTADGRQNRQEVPPVGLARVEAQIRAEAAQDMQ